MRPQPTTRQRFPAVDTPCLHCGTINKVAPNRLADGRGKFCNRACQSAYRQGRPITSIDDRFWSKVRKTESCWLWTGSAPHGYGQLAVVGPPKRMIRAHRLSWELHRGPIPDGLSVLHNCPGGDNPRCVNPDHLFLGTHDDNMADCKAKGRNRFGVTLGLARSNPVIASAILNRYITSTLTRAEVAREFGVRVGIVARIVANASDPRQHARHVVGEAHGKTHLTTEAVREMRERHARGNVTLGRLAADYGVSKYAVRDILRRRTWRHVE